jgi:hypothetical protein
MLNGREGISCLPLEAGNSVAEEIKVNKIISQEKSTKIKFVLILFKCIVVGGLFTLVVFVLLLSFFRKVLEDELHVKNLMRLANCTKLA